MRKLFSACTTGNQFGLAIRIYFKFSSMILKAIIIAVLLVILRMTATAQPQATQFLLPPPYDLEKPVPRTALVIGNTAYTTQQPLPSADEDAKLVAKKLRALDFDVTEVHDVRTQSDFYNQFFRPFLDKIQPGSISIFYFSGHGFSFAGESYLTPTSFPAQVPYSRITATFMSVTALRDMISERQPSVSMMVLDACRNMSNFIDTNGGSTNQLQTKGLTAPHPDPSDTLVWFASDEGSVSYADPTGAPSIYTGVFATHLAEDKQIDLVRKVIRIEVMSATQNNQVPWSSESSSAEFWLHPTKNTLDEIRGIWVSALTASTRNDVSNFLALYGSSPFADAARLWLAKHPRPQASPVPSISGAAPEALWNNQINVAVVPAIGATDTSNLALALNGPFGLSRTIAPDATVKISMAAHARSSSLLGAAFGANRAASLTAVAAAPILANQAQLVTQESVTVQQSPTVSDGAVSLPPGVTMNVDGVVFGPGNSRWLSVSAPGLTSPGVIRVPQLTRLTAYPIGTALREVIIPAVTGEPAAMVADGPIVAALDELNESKKAVTWVSISTPAPSSPREARLLSLRANYAAYILTNHGVARNMISTAEGSAPAQVGLRLRFFGREQ